MCNLILDGEAYVLIFSFKVHHEFYKSVLFCCPKCVLRVCVCVRTLGWPGNNIIPPNWRQAYRNIQMMIQIFDDLIIFSFHCAQYFTNFIMTQQIKELHATCSLGSKIFASLSLGPAQIVGL